MVLNNSNTFKDEKFMTIECDVLVVGAGPAGSSAARSAAMNGAKTIFIDKKEEIGFPVQCAEGIGEYLFPYMPFKIPDEQLVWKMDGMFFWVDNISIEKTGGFWKSYSVNRRNFDRWLSTLAVDTGATLFTKTELIDLELDQENNIKKAIVKRKEKTIDIKPKVVVAADGSESTVLKLLGLYNPKEGDLAEVYSWEMKNLDLYKPNLEQIFTGEFTPSGYAYIFPKGKNTANMGVGGIYPKKKMEKYFEEFLEIPHVKKQIKNAEYTFEKTGKAVWNDLSEKWIYGNLILAGDVANQNLKPFIEGILPSIICGDLAGDNSINFCKGNITHNYYVKIIIKKIGQLMNHSNQIKELTSTILKENNKKKYLQFFGIITESLDDETIKKTFNMEYEEIKRILL